MRRLVRVATMAGALLAVSAAPVLAAPAQMELKLDGIGSVAAPVQIVILLTLLTLLPAVLMTMTCFTRIVIVFHFLRQALGTQEVPSNQILIGLALFLTLFVMAPVADRLNVEAVQPAMAGKLDLTGALEHAAPAIRDFMLRQTREKDLQLFIELSHTPRPKAPTDLPLRVVIPAYIISELKTGFQMGFFLFVPFLLIDLVVSTTLLSMGMLQLPPALVSLPFKILLFVMIDGWNLIVSSVVRSFA